jgi:hypothetical protein
MKDEQGRLLLVDGTNTIFYTREVSDLKFKVNKVQAEWYDLAGWIMLGFIACLLITLIVAVLRINSNKHYWDDKP